MIDLNFNLRQHLKLHITLLPYQSEQCSDTAQDVAPCAASHGLLLSKKQLPIIFILYIYKCK